MVLATQASQLLIVRYLRIVADMAFTYLRCVENSMIIEFENVCESELVATLYRALALAKASIRQ